jgi:hypothetical protein
VLTDDFDEFFERPVAVFLGTRDAALIPDTLRAFGVRRLSDMRAAADSRASRVSDRERAVWYYAPDDSVFVDEEYVIKGVAGRILAKLLRHWLDEGRTHFTNKEIRLDKAMGLPPVNDSLESRLLLLRKRLADKPCGIRLEKAGRGRLELVVEDRLTLDERA